MYSTIHTQIYPNENIYFDRVAWISKYLQTNQCEINFVRAMTPVFGVLSQDIYLHCFMRLCFTKCCNHETPRYYISSHK